MKKIDTRIKFTNLHILIVWDTVWMLSHYFENNNNKKSYTIETETISMNKKKTEKREKTNNNERLTEQMAFNQRYLIQ